MPSVTSNLPAYGASLYRVADALRLTRNGLGDDVIDAATDAIVERTVNRQEQPDGERLAKLKPSTVKRKARLGLDPRILVEHHVMLDRKQVRGETAVTATSASMTAGLDDETKAKVDYAHAGSDNREKRPFYDPGADGEAAVDRVFEGAADDAIRGA